MAPVPLLPTQKCTHLVRTLLPLGNAYRVSAWLTVVLAVCEFLACLLTHASTEAATIFLCDFILCLNSLSRDLGIKHSQGVPEHSWDCVSVVPGLWVPHPVFRKETFPVSQRGNSADEPRSGVLVRSNSETSDRTRFKPDGGKRNGSSSTAKQKTALLQTQLCPCGRGSSVSPPLDSTWI